MKPHEIALLVALTVGFALVASLYLRDRARRERTLRHSPKRVLFPFVGSAISRRALDSALRLSRVDGATLVPVYLAQVPLTLPLDGPLPRQCDEALPLLEAIEQRAAGVGVPVDARIEPGRNHRHSLRRAIAGERFDRIVVSAVAGQVEGLHTDDIAWLLDHAPGEVVVIRPAGDDRLSRRRAAQARSDERAAARAPAVPA